MKKLIIFIQVLIVNLLLTACPSVRRSLDLEKIGAVSLADASYPLECYSQDTLQNRVLSFEDFDNYDMNWSRISDWVNQGDSLAPRFNPENLWSDRGDLRFVQVHRYCTCNLLAAQRMSFYLVVDSVNRDSLIDRWTFPIEPKNLLNRDDYRRTYHNYKLGTNLFQILARINLKEIPNRIDRIHDLRQTIKSSPDYEMGVKTSRGIVSFENEGKIQ